MLNNKELFFLFLRRISIEYDLDENIIKKKWIEFINKDSSTKPKIKKSIDSKYKKKVILDSDSDNDNDNDRDSDNDRYHNNIKKQNVKETYKETEIFKNKETEIKSPNKEIKEDDRDDRDDRDDIKNNNSKQGIVIKFNKVINKFVHRGSGYVFYSKTELVVFGKVIENKVYKLTEEDKLECKRLKFRVDESKYIESEYNYDDKDDDDKDDDD